MYIAFINKIKTVVITGGTKGIGSSIAKKFMKMNWNVVVAARNKSGLASEKHENIKFHKMDVVNESDHSALIKLALEWTGSFNCYINSAGYSLWSPLNMVDETFWNEMISTNLKGTFWGCKTAAANFTKGGSIINISSVSSDFVCGESADYHVGKAGLNQLTRYLAYYGGAKGVRVNGIAPGFIVKKANFDLYDGEWRKRWEGYHPLKKAGYSEDLSNAILFLASDLARFITGQTLVIDGGLTLPVSGFLVEESRQNL